MQPSAPKLTFLTIRPPRLVVWGRSMTVYITTAAVKLTQLFLFLESKERQLHFLISRRTIQVLTIKYITNVFIEWHRNVKTVWLTCFHTFIDSCDTVIVTKFRWQSASRGEVRSAILILIYANKWSHTHSLIILLSRHPQKTFFKQLKFLYLALSWVFLCCRWTK